MPPHPNILAKILANISAKMLSQPDGVRQA